MSADLFTDMMPAVSPKTVNSAVFSDDRLYRYELWRTWEDGRPFCMFIGLNPSTADETKDDPTIRKCIGFAKQWGYGALCMTNLFAWRDTDPKKMRRAKNPVGEQNQHHLLKRASQAGIVIAAWGKHGSHRFQDMTTLAWLAGIGVQLHCLRKNNDGSPQHPLYIPYSEQPKPWMTIIS